MSLGLELGANDAVVLDDAVMHQPDASAGVRVGMGVALGRRTVRRPTGVGDADGALRLTFLGPFGPDLVGQAGDLPHGPQGQHGRSFLHGEAGGVITAIFQTT